MCAARRQRSDRRRDLDDLAAEGVIQRQRGGAISLGATVPESPIYQRAREMAEAKDQIGRAAARLIFDGETVLLGSGSTVLAVAQHLKARSDLIVISNSLPVVSLLADSPGVSVVVLGGLLRRGELSMIGHLTEQATNELRRRRSFWACVPSISSAG